MQSAIRPASVSPTTRMPTPHIFRRHLKAAAGGAQDKGEDGAVPGSGLEASLRLPQPLPLPPAGGMPDRPSAAQRAAEWMPPALREMISASSTSAVSDTTLERWAMAYRQASRGRAPAMPHGKALVPRAHANSVPQLAKMAAPHGQRRHMPRPHLPTVQMAADARELGIPTSAIPALPARPTEEELRAARERLSGIMASFLSAGL